MFPYFLKWVESKDHGQGGSTWVNDHVETFVNIAAPLMGVPKAVTSLLSGIYICVCIYMISYLSDNR